MPEWVDEDQRSHCRLPDGRSMWCSEGQISKTWYIEVFCNPLPNQLTREAAKRAAEAEARRVLLEGLRALGWPDDAANHKDKTMKNPIEDLIAFHQACDVPILPKPELPPHERVALRRDLIDEEVNRELLPAMDRGDLVAIADGMVDAIYVIIGAALEYGIPLAAVWDEIHRSNMAKVDPATGKVHRRADGKVLKPPGWQPPNVHAALTAAVEATDGQ